MAIRLTRVRQFAMKLEGTEGTAETLTASDVDFEVEELSATYENQMNERTPLRSSLSGVTSLPGIGVGTITGKVEIVGGGAVATRPPAAAVFGACGMKEYKTKTLTLTSSSGNFAVGEQVTSGAKEGRVVVGGLAPATIVIVDITDNFADTDAITGTDSGATATVNGAPVHEGYAYATSTDTEGSYTAQANLDRVLTKIYGSRGNLTIDIEGAGKLGYLNFTLSGQAAAPADAALLTGLTLPTQLPQAFLSAGVLAGSDSLCVDGMSVDLGNNVAPRMCSNQANGIISYRITDRAPVINIAPEADLEANIAFWNKYSTATEFRFQSDIGTAQYRRARVIAPKAMYSTLTDGEREGIHAYDAQLACNGDQPEGDDELFVAFW